MWRGGGGGVGGRWGLGLAVPGNGIGDDGAGALDEALKVNGPVPRPNLRREL